MADSIGSLAVIVTATTDGLAAGLKGGANMVNKFASDTLRTMKTVSVALATMGGISAAGGLAATIGDMVKDSVRLAGEYEQMQISFGVMMGSAEKADNLLVNLRKFAAESPITFEKGTKAVKQIIAAGIPAQDAIATLRMLTDVASGTGAELSRLVLAHSQVMAAGRLYGTELRQFTEAGVPLLEELAKTMGKPVAMMRLMTEEGKVGRVEYLRAMKDMTEGTGRFAGMTEKYAKSFHGRVEQMQDAFNILKMEFGTAIIKETGLDEATQDLSKFANRARSFVDDMRPFLRFMGDLGRGLANVANEGGKIGRLALQTGDKFLNAAFPGLNSKINETVLQMQTGKIDAVTVLEAGEKFMTGLMMTMDYVVEGIKDMGKSLGETMDKVAKAADRLTEVLGFKLDEPPLKTWIKKQAASDINSQNESLPQSLTAQAMADKLNQFRKSISVETGVYPTPAEVDAERRRLEQWRAGEIQKWQAGMERPKSSATAIALQFERADHLLRSGRFALSGAAAWFDPNLVPTGNAPLNRGNLDPAKFNPQTAIQKAMQDFMEGMKKLKEDAYLAGIEDDKRRAIEKHARAAERAYVGGAGLVGGAFDGLAQSARNAKKALETMSVPARGPTEMEIEDAAKLNRDLGNPIDRVKKRFSELGDMLFFRLIDEKVYGRALKETIDTLRTAEGGLQLPGAMLAGSAEAARVAAAAIASHNAQLSIQAILAQSLLEHQRANEIGRQTKDELLNLKIINKPIPYVFIGF